MRPLIDMFVPIGKVRFGGQHVLKTLSAIIEENGSMSPLSRLRDVSAFQFEGCQQEKLFQGVSCSHHCATRQKQVAYRAFPSDSDESLTIMRVESPLCLYTDVVPSQWIDYNGHMNVAYYVLAFDRATDAFMDFLGMGRDYRDNEKCSAFVVDVYKRQWQRAIAFYRKSKRLRWRTRRRMRSQMQALTSISTSTCQGNYQ